MVCLWYYSTVVAVESMTIYPFATNRNLFRCHTCAVRTKSVAKGVRRLYVMNIYRNFNNLRGLLQLSNVGREDGQCREIKDYQRERKDQMERGTLLFRVTRAL